MAEVGIQQTLISSDGDTTITFNDWANDPEDGVYMVDGLDGFDGAELRTSTDDRPQRDGLIIHPTYDGARVWAITGRIIPTSIAAGNVMQDNLRAVCRSMRRADGRYTFTPTGQSTRFLSVRLGDAISIDNDESVRLGAYDPTIIKRFTIPLIAADPTIYTITEVDTTVYDGGTAVAVSNGGNAESFPVIEVYGPFDNFVITNETTGLEVIYDGDLIGSGHHAEISMYNETIYKDGSGANLLGDIDITDTDFFALEPGTNELTLSTLGGSAYMVVKHNDAWA